MTGLRINTKQLVAHVKNNVCKVKPYIVLAVLP